MGSATISAVADPKSSIAEERKTPSFPIRELTYWIDGGKRVTDTKERIMLELERDPLWKVSDHPNLTLAETRERAMSKVRRLADLATARPLEETMLRMTIVSVVDPGFWTRFGVHFGLFFGALQGQATPSQLGYWMEKGALSMQGITGCFGMTELGHGSNVAGLETTATFDEATDEFVVHSPTLTATKWWIGGAAHTATHCSVYAQLIVKGKNYGTKTFVVQLRDTKTFQLMPGVNIGDLGKKMGRDQIDNGWIRFTHVRIPRSHMLMKHTKVTHSGDVIEPALAQLAYGALIQGRVSMVSDSANVAKRALTIATRYASVRRQFSSGAPGSVETKLIDYPIHQHRLLPLMAQTFAMIFTAREVSANYEKLMGVLSDLGNQSKGAAADEAIKELKETHATSAGLKAFCTWMCLNIIDQCRQSLGGHGYSAYTGLAQAYSDFAVHCTWEGDNTILTLQCGRYLVATALDARKGMPLPANLSYLKAAISKDGSLSAKTCKGNSAEQVSSLDTLKAAWSSVAANAILNAVRDFEAGLAKGLSKDNAYEFSSASRLHAARMHTYTYLLHRFVAQVDQSPAPLRPILTLLAQLFGAHSAVQHSGEFLQSGFYSGAQIETLKGFVNFACTEIRKDAVPLTDAFGYTDYVVNSPLGRYDGDVYEKYFELVTSLNPTKPVPYFDSLIKPLLERTNETDSGPELEIDQEE
ncbi:acyl-CoA dehydrogenase/oxidase C-terminal [Kickxella alabastrina]|uniref:acyl-CoA dehydrogenase/oxidase C-terminal n=1 Tax=Kickxella alabastrina TaxID=61397 RepID=UPI00221E7DA4|nr:acyl-CoA dehydrogenase/oxidase C-terminal [Kickxella alabastrina]KAI7834896.1 acyl-CoA dehydrogenase/oxidase C-terminal [Kickxella alabastrina]KAJ1947934.1 fatty-acyl coenzyme A oxidase [Kickxella alabastrina]